MKLSEIKGKRVFDVLADLVEPITAIAEDKAFKQLMEAKRPSGVDAGDWLMSRMKKALPSLLRTRKDEIIRVLAIVNGVTPEEYGSEVTFSKLMSDAYDILTDGDLLGFLSSAGTDEE